MATTVMARIAIQEQLDGKTVDRMEQEGSQQSRTPGCFGHDGYASESLCKHHGGAARHADVYRFRQMSNGERRRSGPAKLQSGSCAGGGPKLVRRRDTLVHIRSDGR